MAAVEVSLAGAARAEVEAARVEVARVETTEAVAGVVATRVVVTAAVRVAAMEAGRGAEMAVVAKAEATLVVVPWVEGMGTDGQAAVRAAGWVVGREVKMASERVAADAKAAGGRLEEALGALKVAMVVQVGEPEAVAAVVRVGLVVREAAGAPLPKQRPPRGPTRRRR